MRTAELETAPINDDDDIAIDLELLISASSNTTIKTLLAMSPLVSLLYKGTSRLCPFRIGFYYHSSLDKHQVHPALRRHATRRRCTRDCQGL